MSNPFSFIEKPKENTEGSIFDFIDKPQNDCEPIPVKEDESNYMYCQGCHSGGGGTNDYNQLLNKPSINGQILKGDIEIESITKIDNDTIVKNENNELSVAKAKYGLNIGPWHYDGSSEVSVEIYEGEMEINNVEQEINSSQQLRTSFNATEMTLSMQNSQNQMTINSMKNQNNETQMTQIS